MFARIGRRGRPLAVAALVAIGLSACAAPSTNGGPAEPDEPTTLRIGVPAATLASLDPGVVLRTGSQSVAWSVYSRLTELDGDGEIVGDLAIDWEQESETSWRFTLRDDAVFEDGTPLDADVVVWNFERYLGAEAATPVSAAWRGRIESFEKVDDHSVRLITTNSFLSLPAALSQVFMTEPEWMASNDVAVDALGSGPYTLVSYTPETRAVLQANPDHHGDAPEFEEIEVIAYAESSTRLAALRNREIDLTITIDPVDLAELGSYDFLTYGGSGGSREQALQLNFNVPAFQDIRVRQALNYAIDRESIVEAIYAGTTSVSRTQVITPVYLGYDESADPWPYDMELAQQLIAESDFPDGFTVDVNVPQVTYAGAEQAIQVIADSWAELGVTLEIGVLPSGAWSERNTVADLDEAPDIVYWGIVSLFLDPVQVQESWIANRRGNNGQLPNHEDYDSIVRAAQAAADSDELIELIHEANAWLRDEAATIWLWEQPQTYAYNHEILSWEPRYDDWIDYMNITRAR